jgi:hypothetical protein
MQNVRFEMIEINVRQPHFLGEPINTDTHGFIFKRLGPRDWELYKNKLGGWKKITDDNVIDALEAGYAYGRKYLRWQIDQCHC